ncbi:zinc transport system ATP-binding protein [Azospirillum fermentarium]|uniref:zinc ABC transporter ATP-binding protein ZnuC n=1 Tax=Azospirillum fermentarium TaxID=1233114 RepID=UPI002227791C|nr:zinc ABC transporter ATP-binding protein ZnuC [Azospirillum fermentarium]MCW2245653.1 zinc transport system ATP-binding protein [Azospirillum fermentarium]
MSTVSLPPSPLLTAADALLSVRGLTVRRSGRAVLDRVDLDVWPGEVVTLIGPNGAGKTTLVRAVLGLVTGDSGTVERRAGLRIGYMPQKLALDATLPLTVRRFLSLWRPVPRARIDAALDEAGVAHTAEQPVQAVSGGEMQRVLLARALLGNPDLLVLDEPDQGVDVQGQADLFTRIDALRRTRGCGVLLVSHDLHTVMARTDRVLCLNRHVCCAGSPEDVRRHPEYHALFGRHAADLAVYVHHHDHTHTGDGRVVPTEKAAEKPADTEHGGHCRHG